MAWSSTLQASKSCCCCTEVFSVVPQSKLKVPHSMDARRQKL